MDRPMYVKVGPSSLRDKDTYEIASKLAASLHSPLGSIFSSNSAPNLDLNLGLNLFLKPVQNGLPSPRPIGARITL